MKTISIRNEEHFWSKVTILADINKCWLWTDTPDRQGYGIYKWFKAHRVAYKLFYGDFDYTLHVLHKCDNPSCVNPYHLFLGTNDDNVKDKMKKGRHNTGKGNTRYSFEDVTKMREMYGTGKYLQKDLCEIFNCERSQMQRILTMRVRKEK